MVKKLTSPPPLIPPPAPTPPTPKKIQGSNRIQQKFGGLHLKFSHFANTTTIIISSFTMYIDFAFRVTVSL